MKLPFVSRKKYDNLMSDYSDYKELVCKLEQDKTHLRKLEPKSITKKHIVLQHIQKSMYVERELGLKMAKRVLLSKLKEIIGIGDQATILFEVKPLPIDFAYQLYPEEMTGISKDGQYVKYIVNGDIVTRKEWLEEFNKNCFVLRCHVFVEDIKNEIPECPEYSEFLPYEEFIKQEEQK